MNTIAEILQAKTSSRALPPDTQPTDLEGNPININTTLEELGINRICYGTDILDWIVADHCQKNPEIMEMSRNKRRLYILDELDRQFSNESSARGLKRDSPKTNRTPKSPTKHRRNFKASRHLTPTKMSQKSPNLYQNLRIQDYRKTTVDEYEYTDYSLTVTNWHSQNSTLNDLEHYFHFIDEESTFNQAVNHMVPYARLEHSRFKNHMFKTLLAEGKPDYLHQQPKDFSMNPSNLSFEEWLYEMDDQVFIKKREHLEVSVSFLSKSIQNDK